MKKAALAAALLLAGFAGMGAMGNKYAAGMGLYPGASDLKMTENVYKDASSRRLISRIDWDIGLQPCLGAFFFVEPEDPFKQFGLGIAGNYTGYFPVNDRLTADSDWEDDGALFSYGESPASSLSGIAAEGRLAALIPLRNKYLIEAAVTLWYSRHGSAAHDGWVQQAPPGEGWDSRGEKRELYGTSMTYFQEWLACAPEAGFRLRLNNGHIGIRAAVSPFVWGYHIDNHYFKKLDEADPEQKYVSYADSVKSGLYWKIQGEYFWNLTHNVQIGAAVDYRAVENARGDTITTSTGLAQNAFFDEGMAGAAIRSISVDFILRTIL